jgi:integrase
MHNFETPPVDLEAGALTVRRTLQRVEGELVWGEPKSQGARRTVPLPGPPAALWEHRRRQLEERLALGEAWRETGLVFTSSMGTPLEPRRVHRLLQRLLQQAGLRSARFRDPRHTAASFLLALGVHPRVAMETLGRSQVSLTMDTYSHVLPALQREAAERLRELLGG